MVSAGHSVGEGSLFWIPRLNPLTLLVPGLFSLATWHGIHVHLVTNLVSGGPRLVTYLALCDRLATATELLPAGRAAAQ